MVKHDDIKVQPQARDLEEAVLGALLVEDRVAPKALAILKEEYFYVPAHRRIYGVIEELYNRSQPIDLLTVKERLAQRNELDKCGGMEKLLDLTNRVASGAHIEKHARIIQEKYLLRQLIARSRQVQHDAYEDSQDVFDLLDSSLSEFIRIRNSVNNSRAIPIAKVAASNLQLIERLRNQEVDIVGIPTGFRELDKVLSGLQGGSKIEVAGRPGMGKSAFVLSIINHVGVDQGRPVALFSLEMPAKQQELRLKSMRSGIPLSRLLTGKVSAKEWPALMEATGDIADAPIYIDDSGTLNVIELRSKVLQMKHEHGLQLVVIDYLQLMNGIDERGRVRNRENEIAQISRATKQLAVDLDIPIIEVSQLSRAAEQRSNKQPLLSDLRESGAIEQDADVVIFPYRPEYYGITSYDDGQPTKGIAELIIAKHRNGACKTIPVAFEASTVSFKDLEDASIK